MLSKKIKISVVMLIIVLLSCGMFGCGNKTTSINGVKYLYPIMYNGTKAAMVLEGKYFSDEVLIQSEVKGYSVITIGFDSFMELPIRKVSLPHSVISIEERAFWNCTNLQEVDIQGKIKRIGSQAFGGCTALESITINGSTEESLQPGAMILTEAFLGCTKLKEVNLKNVVRIYPKAFAECASLKSIILPEGLTHIYANTFENCTALTKIYIPTSVTSIDEDAFNGLPSLEIYCAAASAKDNYKQGWNSDLPVKWSAVLADIDTD